MLLITFLLIFKVICDFSDSFGVMNLRTANISCNKETAASTDYIQKTLIHKNLIITGNEIQISKDPGPKIKVVSSVFYILEYKRRHTHTTKLV